MTVQEILDELQLKYPHSYTNTQVVNRLDRLQKRIFRQLNTIQESTVILTSDSSAVTYSNAPRTIRKFLIDDLEYPYWRIEDSKPARYYYWESNTIYFYPQAKSGSVITLWKSVIPSTLSSGSLTSTPALDIDFHMLLVYGVAKEIAEDLRDGSMATAFAVAYNDLFNEMQQGYQNPESYSVKEIPWG